MSRKLIVLLGIVFVFSLVAGEAQAQVLRRGMRSDKIADVQEILKTDPNIYPEGLVTGYFGPLTQAAVRRLQARCGVSQTGEIGPETEECIFPVNRRVRVLSPNGGERWDRGEIQTIKWEVTFSPEQPIRPEEKRPFWDKASIDLFRQVLITPPCEVNPATGIRECPEIITRKSIFVKHIATVDMFDLVYSWRIGSDVANGDDYVIRVSIGPRILPLYRTEKKPALSHPGQEEVWGSAAEEAQKVEPDIMPPYPWGVWDESDRPFTITGEIVPPIDLKQVIELLQEAIAKLNTALKLLYEMR